MTAFDRFDLLDARVSGALEEIGAASRPDYIDDIFKVTARTDSARAGPSSKGCFRWIPPSFGPRADFGSQFGPWRSC